MRLRLRKTCHGLYACLQTEMQGECWSEAQQWSRFVAENGRELVAHVPILRVIIEVGFSECRVIAEPVECIRDGLYRIFSNFQKCWITMLALSEITITERAYFCFAYFSAVLVCEITGLGNNNIASSISLLTNLMSFAAQGHWLHTFPSFVTKIMFWLITGV